jgi:hypothetical protein
MCFSVCHAANCIHYRPGFSALNGYVMLVQGKPVLGRVQASMAPICRSCFTRLCWKEYGTNIGIMPGLCFSLTNCISTLDVIPLHVQRCSIVYDETRAEGTLCSRRGVSGNARFWELKGRIVCFSYNIARATKVDVTALKSVWDHAAQCCVF